MGQDWRRLGPKNRGAERSAYDDYEHSIALHRVPRAQGGGNESVEDGDQDTRCPPRDVGEHGEDQQSKGEGDDSQRCKRANNLSSPSSGLVL